MVKVKEDLTGMIFGRLKVIQQVEDVIRPCGKHEPRWLCECSCDEHNMIIVEGAELKRTTRNGSKSCGCLQKELLSERTKKYNQYDLSGDYGIGWTTNTDKEFYFDLEDYDIIKDYCWFEADRYITARIGTSHIRMHQLLFGKNCDHINHNGMDNRKNNLRQATHSENMHNKSIQKNNTSGVIGVYFSNQSNKWVAQLRLNNKSVYCGGFTDKEDAIRARLNAEVKYYGEFAPQKHLYEQYGITEQND